MPLPPHLTGFYQPDPDGSVAGTCRHQDEPSQWLPRATPQLEHMLQVTAPVAYPPEASRLPFGLHASDVICGQACQTGDG